MANEILSIRVRAEYPWDTAQVGGQRFSKREPLQRQASEVSDEIRTSPILEITPIETETVAAEPNAPIETETVAALDEPEVSDAPASQSKRAGRKAG